MEGGRIVQCGTPQEIFRNPSNDYVAEFVAHMNPLGVLRARDVMEPAAGSPEHSVDANSPIADVMSKLTQSGGPVAVEEAGRIIGQVSSGES